MFDGVRFLKAVDRLKEQIRGHLFGADLLEQGRVELRIAKQSMVKRVGRFHDLFYSRRSRLFHIINRDVLLSITIMKIIHRKGGLDAAQVEG